MQKRNQSRDHSKRKHRKCRRKKRKSLHALNKFRKSISKILLPSKDDIRKDANHTRRRRVRYMSHSISHKYLQTSFNLLSDCDNLSLSDEIHEKNHGHNQSSICSACKQPIQARHKQSGNKQIERKGVSWCIPVTQLDPKRKSKELCVPPPPPVQPTSLQMPSETEVVNDNPHKWGDWQKDERFVQKNVN